MEVSVSREGITMTKVTVLYRMKSPFVLLCGFNVAMIIIPIVDEVVKDFFYEFLSRD